MPEGEEHKGKEGEAAQETALEALTQKLVKASGNAELGPLKEIVQDLYRDAVDTRSKNRELNREVATLKGKMKDGDVVLTGDDAKAWQAIQKIGIPANEISKKLTEGTEAQQKLGVLERDRVADEIAQLTGQNPSALRGIVRLQNLNIAIQEQADPSGAVDGEGKKKRVRVPVVIPVGDKAEPVAWNEFVEQNLGDFREILTGSESERNGSREPPAGPRIVRQRAGEQGAGAGVTDEAIATEVRRRHPMLNGI